MAEGLGDAAMSELRDRLAREIFEHNRECSCCPTIPKPIAIADAVLPVIVEHTAAEILRHDASIRADEIKRRFEERERIAAVIERWSGYAIPVGEAARIVREEPADESR